MFDINVWFKRSLKTKLHPMIVRQYSHLKSDLGTIIQCYLSFMKYSPDLQKYYSFDNDSTISRISEVLTFSCNEHLKSTILNPAVLDWHFVPNSSQLVSAISKYWVRLKPEGKSTNHRMLDKHCTHHPKSLPLQLYTCQKLVWKWP